MRTNRLWVHASVLVALAAVAGCGPNQPVDAGDGGGADGGRDVMAPDAPDATRDGGDAAMDATRDGGDAAMDADSGPTCTGGQTLCGTSCVNLQNDPANCGACGTACATGMLCTGGSCQTTCGTGESNCGGGCVDLQTDPTHCGGCATACTAGANGAASCTAGACGTACNPGFADCDGDATNGCEVDTSGDPAHCGSCATSCGSPANGSATCAASTCALECNAGFADCDGNAANGCEVDTASDAMHCGSCATACTAGMSCGGASCHLCSLATVGSLTVGSMVSGTLMGTSRIDSTSCQGSTQGPEDIYVLNITARTGVELSTGGSLDTVLSIRSDCAAQGTEAACDDDGGAGTLSMIRTVLDPGEYFVVVDRYASSATTTGGAYTLSVDPWTPAANSTCATAAPLTAAAPLTGQDTAGGAARSTACATSAEGGQLFYSVDVPAGQRATLTATPSASPMLQPTIRVLDSCTATSCVANATASSAGAAATAVVENRGTATRHVTVSVSSQAGLTNGLFDLAMTLETIPTVPNATCSMATPITGTTTLMGENAALGSDSLTSACVSSGAGGVLYYRLTVPAGNAVSVHATPRSSWDPVVRLLNACGATSCLHYADDGAAGSAETLTFSNPGANPVDYVLAVGSYNASTTGLFDLAVTYTPPAPNATCAGATAVTDGSTLSGQDLAGASQPLNGACTSHGGSTPGNVLYYVVNVPTGNTLTVNVTPTGFNAVVQILPSCGATTCTASRDAAGSGSAETLSYDNAGATADFVIAVGSYSASTVGAFGLSVTVAPTPTAPANAMCSNAIAVAPGTPLTGQDLSRAADGFNAACPNRGSSSTPGHVLYYRVTVPGGNRLTATVAPTAFDAVVQLLPSCGAATCSASRDSTGSGSTETLNFDNVGSTADFILAVGNYSTSSVGTFSVSVALAPLPFTETATAPLCDDMSGATALGVTAHTTTSTIQALPFSFTFFGTAMTAFSAASNGFAQLWPSMTGTPSSTTSNAVIPTTGSPNSYLAPFWDDLLVPSGGGNNVHVATFGTDGSRHFTIQWTNWAVSGDTNARLTFQAQLYEGTNVVEFHYCSLATTGTSTAPSTGSGATVGIENSAGTDGIQHSYNRSGGGAVSTATALRYTPVP